MKNNNLVIGVLAHVDAGKTTLSEALLYASGAIRKLGRVDHGTAFLDGNSVERDRGITVFAKEARLKLGEKKVVLLDTPGHADFGTEAERTLQVLDYGLLIISGAEGVQGHTVTLWKLLEAYRVPVFVFVNKMDQPGCDRAAIMENLKKRLGGGFAEFDGALPVSWEEAADRDEGLMEEYFEKDCLSGQSIAEAIRRRTLFPVCFGSALKMDGIDELMDTLEKYTVTGDYPQDFGARVYKISRDKQGNRLTHIKVTGGVLRSKMTVEAGSGREKTEQIRLYSGASFETVMQAEAGAVCAVTGLYSTYAGQGLGRAAEEEEARPRLEPALTYRILLPPGLDPAIGLQRLKMIEEEEPALKVTWKEASGEIHISVMGRLEMEVLQHTLKERFDMKAEFGDGRVIYKETIAEPVIGIGHFEPLKHYAEVHLLMEPLPEGSGLVLDSALSEDVLDRNWQRLIIGHLAEREHPGVLTGSPVTDMKLTLIGGRAHLKHTEGGDFRQAAYRAVRQGLRKGTSLLLEPMYKFTAEIPEENVGRLLSDMQRMGADCQPQEFSENQLCLIRGRGPAACLRDYQQEVRAYTRGLGSFSVFPDGYGRCCNQQEVIEAAGYDPEADADNPTGSVFCSGGKGVYVRWDRVDEMAHADSAYRPKGHDRETETGRDVLGGERRGYAPDKASEAELEEIFLRTYGKSKKEEDAKRRRLSREKGRPARPETMSGSFPRLKEDKGNNKALKPYYVVDGYNVIFAWDELAALAKVNIDSAREALIEILENYASYKKTETVAVFDGYKVSGNSGSRYDYGYLKAVYTREAQTADRFIEETVYEMTDKFNVTVVTSDRAVQMAALGDGAARLSAREFYEEVNRALREIRDKLGGQRRETNRPFEESLSDFKI